MWWISRYNKQRDINYRLKEDFSPLLQITQLKIEYNPFAKGFRGSELCGTRRYTSPIKTF